MGRNVIGIRPFAVPDRRIVSTRPPWVASPNTMHRQDDTAHGAILAQGFDGILGARRGEVAAAGEVGGNDELVEAYESYEEARHHVRSVPLPLPRWIVARRGRKDPT